MKPWFSIKNLSETSNEVMLYGEIGGGWSGDGVEAKAFADELNKIPKENEITLRIHSPGGSVWDGLAIYNILLARKDKVTARIDGMALSAASFIAMAAKTIEMPKTARMMIHDAQGLVWGDADDMKETAALLDRESDNIAGIYADRTGLKREEVRQMMRETTWMTGEEAKTKGFCDVVTDLESARNTFDLSRFKLVPGADGGLTPPPTVTTQNHKATMSANAKTATSAEAQPSNDIAQNADPTSAITPDILRNFSASVAELTEATKRIASVQNIAAAAASADPVPIGMVENVGDADDLYRGEKDTHKRRQFLVNAWNDIRKVREKRDPKNVNTISATLTTALLSDTVVTVLQNRLAPIKAFFTEVMTDPVKPLATIQVPKVTGAATAQTDPSDWESGNTTVTNTAITMHEYSVSFHLTSTELQSGSRIDWLTRINAAAFANKILDVLLTPVVVGTFTNTPVTAAAAAFGNSDIRALWASAKNFTLRNLVVDGDYWAQMMPGDTQGFGITQGSAWRGFDGVWYSNRWSAAGPNVVGFVASPESMVVASALPIDPPGASSQFASLGATTIPDIGVQVQTSSWLKPGTRVQWQAFDMLFGVAACDASALTILKSA